MADKIVKFLAYNGKVSVICADTTELTEKARLTHDLTPVATATLGRVLTITAIMAVEMKNSKDKLTVQVRGNGPLETIVVTANNVPKLKGYVGNPRSGFTIE